ncbi:sigma-70 family RNA polymerase sigma factor [Sedimentibacter sp. MB31-C6]|uniref:sigma-70 family RNA polymerase sigma factor n=1 Tax=Sedimentibacter sp. MB31-C6 TaxID=3109366 RepID=UPI002DDD4AD3|nr:FliA/WhiG family RNA polymerase sigma factor [Sedimentibacter sp. MB36-C1]WSI04976.1 FliA/WhiG family RNA polymerase sigma factor [Sedimentibacter sp. MB36-C1]
MTFIREKVIDDEKLWEQYLETKDINIRNQIIEKYSYLVKVIALKLRGSYQQFGEVDDVVNEGIIALMDVIDKFDLSHNVKFETYATIRIKGAIIDYVRKQDWIPRKVKNEAKIVKKAEDELYIKLGRTPNDNEIADYLKIDINDYNQILSNSYKTSILSFEDLLGEANLRENEISNGYELPEDVLETKELYKVLKESIKELKEKEKLVVSLYYKEELKLKDIANILNISTSRVSQIHTKVLEKLKESIREYLNSYNK